MEFNRWQRLFLSFSSGILLFGGWAGGIWQWLVIFAFVPLLLVEHYLYLNKHHYKSYHFFLYAYLSFIVWNAFSTWWIMKATLVGAILAIVLNAFFAAIVAWLFHLVKRNTSIRIGYMFFIASWLAFEYLHFNWELSWTWMTLGNAFSEQVWFVQWYEYTGVLGGSLFILLVNVCFILIFIQWIIDAYVKRKLIVALLFLLIIPSVVSLWKYHHNNDQGIPVRVLIIQPNIDPYNDKFSGMSVEEQIQRIIELTQNNIQDNNDYVIGPETALPQGIWEEDLDVHPQIIIFKKLAAKYKNSFILGASTYRMFDAPVSPVARKFDDGNGYYEAYNTALQIDSNKIQVFHKSKLVLGVEKMPFPKTLSFLEDLALDLGGTSGSLGTQTEPTIFEGKSKVAPAICYESVYGEYLSKFIIAGAQWIAVITNDGWWDDTPGYRQHLSYSRLRAIEFRKSIARSANTGISAIINQRGDIITSTSWWKPEAIKGTIYANNIKTFYSIWGDYIGRIAQYLTILLLLVFVSKLWMKKLTKFANAF
ncbi:MAG: apolipoprotein N-acyltransferase [Bacteroidales bacterium]|nr:apolipoprotein N-acyltransferase [Bacteroidales bacterium]